MKTIKFLFLVFLCLFGVLYALYFSYIYFNQTEMVFKVTTLPKDYKFSFNQDFEEINIKTTDSKNLSGLLFKTKHSKGLVFYLHGNAGALDSWGNIASRYTNLGYDFFILDYRGFGKSEGSIDSEEQFFDDANSAYKLMVKQYSEKNIVIIGYSIGTGVATWLAAKSNPKVLIVKAPFYNFKKFTSGIVPYFPDRFKKFEFETNKYIVKVKAPIYIFHGDKDLLIPFQNSIDLSKLIKNKDSLFILNDVGHLGINENDFYLNKLKTILN